MTIRATTLGDREAILAIHRAVADAGGGIAREPDEISIDTIDAFLTKSMSSGVALVACIEGSVIGEIHASQFVPRCFHHILAELTIAIDPAAQGRGVGRLLFGELLRIVREERSTFLRVELWVRASNVRGVALYRSLGFRIEAEVPHRVHATDGYDTDLLMAWERGGEVPLLVRWEQTWNELRCDAPRGAFDQVLDRWREPHRAFHTLQHLEECLVAARAVRHACEFSCEVELALWYHDAVCDPRSDNNAVKSAACVTEVLQRAGTGRSVRERIADLVRATAHDREPTTRDEAIVMDVDLAILSADTTRFESHERQLRREWGHLSESEFRSWRETSVRRLLDRPSIYRSKVFAAREPAARANLARSLASPHAGGTGGTGSSPDGPHG